MKQGLLVFVVSLMVFLVACQTTTTLDTSLEPKYQTSNNVYSLDVVLDVEMSELSVTGEIYYKNDEYDLNELYLTLYPNSQNYTERENNIVIDYIKIDQLVYEYTITGSDHSQIYIDLDDTLLSGKRISIEFSYYFTYWQNDGRISKHEDEFLTMFFYPFVAIYDDEGWNIDAFTVHGESYYNTIGDYYVSIDTPLDYQVAASGELVDTSSTDTRNTYSYEILNARDFSFSTSENYFVYSEVENERTYMIYSLVELSDLNVFRVFNIITNTFEAYESTIGSYPYDHYTLELGEYFGMESTGIAYCNYDIDEATIVHEIIHQWFYSMVGNDQSDDSFIDEAITTYITSLYYYEQSGTNGYYGYLAFRNSLDERFEDRLIACQGESLLQKVDDFGDQYAYLIYYHGPTMFRYYVDEFLEGDIEEFYRILSVYFNQYKYQVVTLDDLLDVIESESGVQITKEWFMMQITEFQDLDNRP
ncbi:MAG: hypothetical protein JXB08_02090 [Bacilli bacterium]|nr:hypothetical protein [Bacilli bacterium]MBN2876152.1 hypothetical protein [Bacilli bacterium]